MLSRSTKIQLSAVALFITVFILHFFVMEKGYAIYPTAIKEAKANSYEFWSGDVSVKVDQSFNKKSPLSKVLRPYYNYFILKSFGPQIELILEGIDGWFFFRSTVYDPKTKSHLTIKKEYLNLFQQFEAVLKQEFNSELLLAFAPNKILVYPEYLPGSTTWVKHTISQYQKFLHAIQKENISVIDLLETFLEEKKKQQLHFKADPHWNAAGAEIAAKKIAERINLTNKKEQLIINERKINPIGAVNFYLNLPKKISRLSEQSSHFTLTTNKNNPGFIILGASLIDVVGLDALIAKHSGLQPFKLARGGTSLSGKISYLISQELLTGNVPKNIPTILHAGTLQLTRDYPHRAISRQLEYFPKVASSSRKTIDLNKVQLRNVKLERNKENLFSWIPQGENPAIILNKEIIGDTKFIVIFARDAKIRARKNGFRAHYILKANEFVGSLPEPTKTSNNFPLLQLGTVQSIIIPTRTNGLAPKKIILESFSNKLAFDILRIEVSK